MRWKRYVRYVLKILTLWLELLDGKKEKGREKEIGGMISFDDIPGDIDRAINNLQKVCDSAKSAMPPIKVMASQAMNLAKFYPFCVAVGVAVQCIQVYQGQQIIAALREVKQELAVQTGLDAPQKFATQVYDYINQKTKETAKYGKKHLFFLYHPDTDWHPPFSTMVESRPLPDTFYGMSENLDALCVWMRFIRIMFTKTKELGKNTMFHILMPAYRPFVIEEPLVFSEVLQPLCIHGMIHNNMPYVQLNLPRADPDKLDGVGIWKRRRSLLGFFEKEYIPRVLGQVSQEANESLFVENEIRRVRRRKRRRRSH